MSEIYNIVPDPKHTARLKRLIFWHNFWTSVRRWLVFWKWHRTRPGLPPVKWWNDELWPVKIPCPCGLTMHYDYLENIYVCEACFMTQRKP